jgi:hypothetical protein
MITQKLSFLVALVIVVVSVAFLAPQIAFPRQPVVILNETVSLDEDNDYETQFNLMLGKGDQLNIQLNGNGNLVNLIVTQSGSSQPLADQEDQTSYNFGLNVALSGSYVFALSGMGDTDVAANIMITKT